MQDRLVSILHLLQQSYQSQSILMLYVQALPISINKARESSVQLENSTPDDHGHVSHRLNEPPWVSKSLFAMPLCRFNSLHIKGNNHSDAQ